MCSHDFSRWETLTSLILEATKNPRGALRIPSGKEVGTTVLALNGVDVRLRYRNREPGIYLAKIIPLLFNDLQY